MLSPFFSVFATAVNLLLAISQDTIYPCQDGHEFNKAADDDTVRGQLSQLWHQQKIYTLILLASFGAQWLDGLRHVSASDSHTSCHLTLQLPTSRLTMSRDLYKGPCSEEASEIPRLSWDLCQMRVIMESDNTPRVLDKITHHPDSSECSLQLRVELSLVPVATHPRKSNCLYAGQVMPLKPSSPVGE